MLSTLNQFTDKRRVPFDCVHNTPSCGLEHTDTHSCRECGPELFAALQIV